VGITTRPFNCSLCGRESATALIALCAECLSAATELIRGVLFEEGLPLDVDQLLDVDLRDDATMSSKPEPLAGGVKLMGGEQVASLRARLLWSLAARLAAAEQQIDAATDVLMDHGYMDGAEDLREAVQAAVSAAAEGEAVSDVLLEAGLLSGDQSLGEAVQDAVTMAAEARVAREVLTEVGYVSDDQGLARSVRDVAFDMTDRGRRYSRERQYRVNVAAVASRVILRAHSESHAGFLATCATCAADWAVVEEASGVRVPGN
jgi:hypothetical protein